MWWCVVGDFCTRSVRRQQNNDYFLINMGIVCLVLVFVYPFYFRCFWPLCSPDPPMIPYKNAFEAFLHCLLVFIYIKHFIFCVSLFLNFPSLSICRQESLLEYRGESAVLLSVFTFLIMLIMHLFVCLLGYWIE